MVIANVMEQKKRWLLVCLKLLLKLVKDLAEVEMRLLECDHEGVDTRLLMHILMSPYSYIIVHCCDTETIHYSAYQLFKAESQGKNCVFKKEDWIFEYFSYC